MSSPPRGNSPQIWPDVSLQIALQLALAVAEQEIPQELLCPGVDKGNYFFGLLRRSITTPWAGIITV